MEPAVVNPVDEAIQFSQQLEGLGGYIANLLELEQGQKDLVFLWDHEMIFEILFPWQANSVYSGLLWYGLECLRESSRLSAGNSWRVILPEGTRIELEQTLSRMMDKYSALQRRSIPSDDTLLVASLNESLGEFKEHPEYRDVVSAAAQLRNLDHAVARLILFLQRYARPVPFAPTVIEKTQVEYCVGKLRRERKLWAEQSRNDADGVNLACAEALSELEPTTVPTLITATGAVLRKGHPWAKDPLFFALAAHFSRQHPVREARRRILKRNQTHILELVNQTSDMAEAASLRRREAPASSRRHEVPEFLRALGSLQADPFLMEVAALTAEARQAVLTAAQQASDLANELTVLRFTSGGSPQAIIERLMRSFGDSAVSLDSLRWKQPEEITDEVGDILAQDNAVLIEGCRVEGGIAVSWESVDPLDEFLHGISKFCAESGTYVEAVAFRYASGPGLEVKRLSERNTVDLPSLVKRSARAEKSTLVRVDTTLAKFWFDPGDLHFETQFEQGILRRSKFAIHVYRQRVSGLAAQFVCRTATRLISSAALADVLSRVLEEMN